MNHASPLTRRAALTGLTAALVVPPRRSWAQAGVPADFPRHPMTLIVPLAAAALAEQLSAPGWSGLFVACDYGKSWRELIEAAPNGTARAYYRHAQSNELLARPGEQDLTTVFLPESSKVSWRRPHPQ
jgi:hypothetical protein